MKRYITIDGGTTNTRIGLVEDRRTLATVKIPLGAQKSIGNGGALREAIRDSIASLLANHSLTEQDICRILAAGMITSEFGLYKLDHLLTPAGIAELHRGMAEVSLPDISSIPFVFMPGVRTDSDTLEGRDMMRGEETELMGLIDESDIGTPSVYVLPGSHSKLIRLDAEGRITDLCTMLTGEMIAALSGNTILKDAVDLSVEAYDKEHLLMGYRYAAKHGINEALFKTRILKNLFGRAPAETYGFFMGVVLSDEIEAILRDDSPRVVIGGKPRIRDCMAEILRSVSDKEIVTVSDEAVEASTSLGMIRVYEYQN